jgi:5-oxopent-3-ene-1,2,5-tricarboxylate decarboxylase / 2-hydroxyhepta-2,4-diene-1,7-dioate isomerase
MLLDRANAVYGVALNSRRELECLDAQLHRDPYKQPPVAPVLYLRPRNTWNTTGAPIRIPREASALKMAGTLGIVMGRRLSYVLVNDVSIPHESYYRPAIRQRCRDGFCVIGSQLIEQAPTEVRTFVNGELRCRVSLADLARPIERLISDVSEFLTLEAGDILLIGEPCDAPLARADDVVRVEIDGLAPIENRLVLE